MLEMLSMVEVACGQRHHSRYEMSVDMKLKNRSTKATLVVE